MSELSVFILERRLDFVDARIARCKASLGALQGEKIAMLELMGKKECPDHEITIAEDEFDTQIRGLENTIAGLEKKRDVLEDERRDKVGANPARPDGEVTE